MSIHAPDKIEMFIGLLNQNLSDKFFWKGTGQSIYVA